MRAARVRVVDDEDVARLQAVGAAFPDVLDHCARRELHDADEDRQSQLPLRDHLAVVLRVDAIRAVEALGDDGRERRALEGEVHLARDLLEPVLHDHQRDRIDRLHAIPRTEMMRLPSASTSTRSPGSTTAVESNCSTIAGPSNWTPTASRSRR